MRNFYSFAGKSMGARFRFGGLILAFLLIGMSGKVFSQVSVQASAGTMGPSPYTTLKGAFDAINAGTHQGSIIISISANTTEAAAAVLNGNGATPAAYTSVLIRPTADGVSVSGAGSGIGRGLIELNGADNVTIDGDNPLTGGINRNLTIQNTSATTFNSVIRIALATSVVTSADNNTIKNLNIIGSAPGRNIVAATSTSGTEHTTFGILAGAGATTVAPGIAAPANVTSITTTIGSPATALNLNIDNNTVTNAGRGISINGAATTVFDGLQIKNNIVGNPVEGSVDGIYSAGITIGGSANAIIRSNTVYLEGYIASSAAGHGISVGVLSTNTSGATIERNSIGRAINNNGATWPGYGINLGGGSNHLVRNNCILTCKGSQTAGSGAFSTTFGSFGIRIASGTGHQVHYNSIHFTGTVAGSTSTLLVAGIALVGSGQTGCDIRNNVISNQLTGGNPTLYNTVFTCLYLPSGLTNTVNLTLNNNQYYQGAGAQNGIAQVSTTGSAANLYLASNFNAGATSPANNLRSYTSTLSIAGTNDDNSGASALAPPFVSATDVHVTTGSPSFIDLDAQAAVIAGITTDFDGDSRDASTPDIGYDEFTAPLCLGADGGTASPATITKCSGQTTVLTSTGFTTGSGLIYQWKVSTTSGSGYVNVSGGSGANTPTYTTGALTTGTYYYVLEVDCQAGSFVDLSTEAVVTVNQTPTVTVSPNSGSFCGSVQLTASGADSYTWLPVAGLDDATIANPTASALGTTTYTATGTTLGCSSNGSATVTILAAPSGVSAGSSSGSVCDGELFDLNSGPATTAGSILFSENFNGANSWTTVNNSSGGTPADAAWTLRVSPYLYGATTFSSNDVSQFILTNSDDQGSGGTTNTELISPVINATGYSTLSLSYYHYYRDIADAGDNATVEISTNGTTYTVAQTHTTTQGTPAGFVQTSVNLDAYAGSTTLYIKFHYVGTFDWYWAIDNVVLSGTATNTFSWASTPMGFGSTDQNPTGVSQSVATTYDVTVTAPNGCSAGASVLVDMSLAGCMDPQAINYDILAVCEDGSCIYTPGENPANAIPGNVAMNPSCAGNTLDITGYGASGAAQTVVVTGEDVWYEWTPSTEAARLDVITGAFDVLIELQDAGGNLIDFENVVTGLGDEYLNIDGLTPGNLYRIGVRNVDSSLGSGVFTLCIRQLQASGCDYGPGPYALCNTFKADWVGPVTYIFNFTSTTTATTYTKNNGSSTFCVLSTVPGLTWGDTYDVNIQVEFVLTDGLGASETILVDQNSPCQIIVNSQPLAVLRPSDNCANFGPHLLGQSVAAQPFVCGAVNWKWEFTRTDVPELPITHYRGSSNRFLVLNSVPGLTPGGTYDVVVAPVFSYGDGNFGAVDCVSIIGPVEMFAGNNETIAQNADDKNSEVSVEAALYPNPNDGDMINVNISGVTSDVVLIEIIDGFGRVVYTNQFVVEDSLNTIINFEEKLSSGMYVVNFRMNNELLTERFIVQK